MSLYRVLSENSVLQTLVEKKNISDLKKKGKRYFSLAFLGCQNMSSWKNQIRHFSLQLMGKYIEIGLTFESECLFVSIMSARFGGGRKFWIL